jgi:hypothetical protein
MMPAVASILVHARAECVWNVVSDMSTYAQWNGCFLDVRGALRSGERLAFRTTCRPLRGVDQRLTAVVLEVRRHRLIRWLILPPSECKEGRDERRDGVIYEIAIETTSTGESIVRQRLDGAGALRSWLGDRASITRALEGSNVALRDQVEQMQVASMPTHQIEGTIRVSSRHGLRDQLVCRRTGLLAYVTDLVTAWPVTGAA